VRRNGPEGDYHLLTPLEFHADTSELTQMLKKGHHNVKLDEESWKKLYTWMDLNAPYHGTWTEAGADPQILQRRLDLRKLYAFDDYNPEEIVNPYTRVESFVMPESLERQVVPSQKSVIKRYEPGDEELDLGDGVTMKLVSIPAGEFSMGSNDETPVEQPVSRVKIDKGFLMGATEVTLEQYRQFDPDYLNGVYDMHYKDQVKRGYYMNDLDFPVIRVNWQQATAFCDWLSKKTGKRVALPTEAQWEWACRAGTTTPLSFGDLDTDFSKYANFADITVKQMAVSGVNPKPINNPNSTVDFELKDPRSDDGVLHLAEVGSYQPNAWGLYDMHGNVAEWTRSDYRPYPYRDSDGRNGGGPDDKVLRGGSWHDRPFRSTSSYRLGYPVWQQVYHAGFRVIVE
jgi:formylglycine-generating enzyme required for sulfatase activity